MPHIIPSATTTNKAQLASKFFSAGMLTASLMMGYSAFNNDTASERNPILNRGIGLAYLATAAFALRNLTRFRPIYSEANPPTATQAMQVAAQAPWTALPLPAIGIVNSLFNAPPSIPSGVQYTFAAAQAGICAALLATIYHMQKIGKESDRLAAAAQKPSGPQV